MPHPMDVITALPRYADDPAACNRLRRRYDHIIGPFADDIAGARVLDLASHDGRWCYALAATGATSVLGIEGRAETMAEFSAYPDDADKAKVTLRQNDIFEELEALKAAGETFDVITIYGIFYHITEHYRLLLLVQALKPKLIIIDSEFLARARGGMVRFLKNDTSHPLNSIPRRDGAKVELVGTTSRPFVDIVGDITGYQTQWVDWTKLPLAQRDGLDDYYRRGKPRIRGTVAMRPRADKA
ncbi:MAG: class I SAM-dependent methyltransferase [Pseudomonadota bacterium]